MKNGSRQELALQAAIKSAQIRSRFKISDASPINAIDIAEKCGCKVWLKSLPTLEGLYSPEPIPTIIIGSERPLGRRSFTCCHELGHHIFNHGVQLDELVQERIVERKSDIEFVADVFAGYLLMPQYAVRKSIKERGIIVSSITQMDLLYLSSFFGVGYTTMINHMIWSLNVISKERGEHLKKLSLKEIKDLYEVEGKASLVFADMHWAGRPIDIDVGDKLVLPKAAVVHCHDNLLVSKQLNEVVIYSAEKQGIGTVSDSCNRWNSFIRISRRNYDGASQFRFLPE